MQMGRHFLKFSSHICYLAMCNINIINFDKDQASFDYQVTWVEYYVEVNIDLGNYISFISNYEDLSSDYFSFYF